ncbi:MAG: hypothetical protein ABH824_04225 [Nanoarchaeota archaeon]
MIQKKIWTQIKGFIFKDPEHTRKSRKKVIRSKTAVKRPIEKKNPIKKLKEVARRPFKDESRAIFKERVWAGITGFVFKDPESIKKPERRVIKSKKIAKRLIGKKTVKTIKKPLKVKETELKEELKEVKKQVKEKKVKEKEEEKIIQKIPTEKTIKTAKRQIKKPIIKKIKLPSPKIKKIKPLIKGTTKKISPKKISSLKLIKSSENPIIQPNGDNHWEAWQTFNPGVILLDNKVHFLYRAIGEDGLSRLGYAVSSDGFNIDERLPYPVYEHQPRQHQFTIYSYFSGGSWGGCEDPRIVQIDEEDILYMTYTACDDGLRVGLTSIKVKDFLKKRWRWKTPKLISQPGEVHKNWVIFPDKINGKYAILHSINPEISINYVDNLEFADQKYIQSQHGGRPQKMPNNCWDSWIRGAGPPPLKTKEGWLVLYHAMDEHDPGKYKVGAMLLDLNDPTKILHRSPQPILEPDELYENNGFKSGVVYASGVIVKDGNLLVYYGGADSYVCVAYTNFEEFIRSLKQGSKIKLNKKKLRKKIVRKMK